MNGAPLANGGSATWTSGENTVKVTVSNSDGTRTDQKVYTVRVTK